MHNLRKDINIFVITHKIFEPPKQDIYIPLQAGKRAGDLGYLRDDEYADNISDKNRHYSELTALYAIWKHSKADIIGLTHYRRYFTNKSSIQVDDAHYFLVNETDIRYLMKQHDIIIPFNYNLNGMSIKEQYCECHYAHDWDLLEKIISEKYPDYVSSFKTAESLPYLIAWNMFIGKREIMNHYFSWLFDILFEVEKRSDISQYDHYQERLEAFMAERLFTVWLVHHRHQYRLLQMPVIGIVDGKITDPFTLTPTVNQ